VVVPVPYKCITEVVDMLTSRLTDLCQSLLRPSTGASHRRQGHAAQQRESLLRTICSLATTLCTCVHQLTRFCLLLSTIDCLSVPLSGYLSVCHTPSNCFYFFVSRWNRAIFWPSFLYLPLYKSLFFDFLFRPPNAQNLLPRICTKSLISRLV